RLEFDQILGDKLYLRSALEKAPVTFKNGALDVKAAWMDMKNVSNPERYYTRPALALDPATLTCSPIIVGLVGLHIVQKTPSRPQWIWSSFEHVDNVPPALEGAQLSFNDGSGKTMPRSDPNGGFPPDDWANPKVYNVVRVKPVHTSTEMTNAGY